MTNTRRVAPFVAAIAALTAVDLATKWWAVSVLSDGPRELPGPIDLQLSYNTGTAFGMFSNFPVIVVSTVTAALVAVVVNMWRTNHAPTTPVVLVAAGGLANVVDRVEGGGVVDMLYTGWWPTFNLADIFIITGIALWIATTIDSSDNNAAEPRPAPIRTPGQPHTVERSAGGIAGPKGPVTCSILACRHGLKPRPGTGNEEHRLS